MNPIADKSVAIDTNVFSHLTNKKVNGDKHIHKVLWALMDDGIALLVDKDKIIQKEYDHHLKMDDIFAASVDGSEVKLLRYWLRVAPRQVVVRDKDDSLFRHINRVVPEDEEVDRVFVYVAVKSKSPLLSNDKKHIINRRARLKRSIPAARIFTSAEAAAKI